MPKVLTMTPNEGESTEAFAARVAGQVNTFFGGTDQPASPEEAVEPVEEAPTDVSADQEVPEKEAPPA